MPLTNYQLGKQHKNCNNKGYRNTPMTFFYGGKQMAKIDVNKYVYFKDGKFYLTDSARDTIRRKQVITSYSGAQEWCHHIMCELIDLYTGSSKYNYALSSVTHETRMPEIYQENPSGCTRWIENMANETWAIAANETFENMFENLVVVEQEVFMMTLCTYYLINGVFSVYEEPGFRETRKAYYGPNTRVTKTDMN